MRMRRKSRLDERLLSCGDLVTIADLTEKDTSRSKENKEYLDFEAIFKNFNPVRLEIGCGKGKFIRETARENPDINFVACEKISNVLIEAVEQTKRDGATNIHYLNSAAEVLEKYFPAGSVDKIYLNFSNPLPKEGYKKQRLTHSRFLKIYKNIIRAGGEIIQKTDDSDFFEFSLESFKDEGFTIVEVSRDWRGGDAETEHEAKFKAQGKKIFRLIARI